MLSLVKCFFYLWISILQTKINNQIICILNNIGVFEFGVYDIGKIKILNLNGIIFIPIKFLNILNNQYFYINNSSVKNFHSNFYQYLTLEF